MKNINSLAKILFFFFAILSLSLVTVSCNDDEEEKETIDFRSMDLKEYLLGDWLLDSTFMLDTSSWYQDTIEFRGDSICFNHSYCTDWMERNDSIFITQHSYFPITRVSMDTICIDSYAPRGYMFLVSNVLFYRKK